MEACGIGSDVARRAMDLAGAEEREDQAGEGLIGGRLRAR